MDEAAAAAAAGQEVNAGVERRVKAEVSAVLMASWSVEELGVSDRTPKRRPRFLHKV